jgi:hypothetical protein
MTQTTNGRSILVQGRILWTVGNLFTGKQKTNQQTKQVIIDQRTGQPVISYGFGLAIPKVDPQTGGHHPRYVEAYQALHGEALALYPSGQLPPGFALKYKDGDTDLDEDGVPYSKREGYAGHIVLACTTMIPIKFFRFEGNNNILVNDGIKCGDYVEVQLNVKAHPKNGEAKPGLYLNPSAVRLIQPGKEIINTPSGDQIFGQNAPLYNGQIIAPEMGQIPNMMPQQVPAQMPMPQQQQYPQQMPQQAPTQMPVQAPANYNVLPQQFQQQAPAQMPMPEQQQYPQQMPQQAPQGNFPPMPPR